MCVCEASELGALTDDPTKLMALLRYILLPYRLSVEHMFPALPGAPGWLPRQCLNE